MPEDAPRSEHELAIVVRNVARVAPHPSQDLNRVRWSPRKPEARDALRAARGQRPSSSAKYS
jgi:hypothetical protein